MVALMGWVWRYPQVEAKPFVEKLEESLSPGMTGVDVGADADAGVVGPERR